jgi:hypothetical protein
MLEAEAARIRAAYPSWRGSEGEQAHFNAWIETRRGPDTRYNVEDLSSLDNQAIVDTLVAEQEMREGILDTWCRLVIDDPARGIAILEYLSQKKIVLPDIWASGLLGMREGAKQPALRDRLMELLTAAPQEVFNQLDISRATADILEVISQGQFAPSNEDDFWRLFDRTLKAVKLDTSNSDWPQKNDWVSLAINRSMGTLTTAFLSVLFARNLKVGGCIPADLKPRLEELLSRHEAAHRPARVIAASRLSYLYAVDPEWSRANLIPLFDWANEVEALSAWQGYAWQPRIDKKLWLALKPYFLPTFTSERLEQIGDMGRNLAQMLMLVGIEFGPNELPREDARNAIRMMSDEMRGRAINWVVSYLDQRKEDKEDGNQLNDPDELWSKKVWPWLDRVWPPDPGMRSHLTATQFASLAIATNARFPEAVKALTPYMIPSDAYHVISDLAESTHPKRHPRASLALIDAIVDPARHFFHDDGLREAIEQISASDSRVADNAVFRAWRDRLRVQRN